MNDTVVFLTRKVINSVNFSIDFYTQEMHKSLSQKNANKINSLINTWSDKALKGTPVNWALQISSRVTWNYGLLRFRKYFLSTFELILLWLEVIYLVLRLYCFTNMLPEHSTLPLRLLLQRYGTPSETSSSNLRSYLPEDIYHAALLVLINMSVRFIGIV